MRKDRALAVAAVVLAAAAALPGWRTGVKVARLEAELASVQERLAEMQRPIEARPAGDLPWPEPATPPAAIEVALPGPSSRSLDEVRSQVRRTSRFVGSLDGDLAALEDHVDGHMERIDALRQAVGELGNVADNHADVLSGLADEIDALNGELEMVRALGKVISVADGRVVITDADIVLQQGRGEDGLLRGNGNIYTMVEPEQH